MIEDHRRCFGYDCVWCMTRCPHCLRRMLRNRLGYLSCERGCVIRVEDLWPGALEIITEMFERRRRENLLRLQRQKKWLSDRDITEAWNADRHVPMTYEVSPEG